MVARESLLPYRGCLHKRHCYENSARPPRNVVLRSPRRRTWGGVGLGHAKRRRPLSPHMWPSQGHGDCYENSTRPPRHVVLRSPRRRTWGGVGLDHAERRRHLHPLMWPSQGHGDSGETRIPAPGTVRHPEGTGASMDCLAVSRGGRGGVPLRTAKEGNTLTLVLSRQGRGWEFLFPWREKVRMRGMDSATRTRQRGLRHPHLNSLPSRERKYTPLEAQRVTER